MERDGGHHMAAMIHFSHTVTGMGLRPVPVEGREGVEITVVEKTALIFPFLPALCAMQTSRCEQVHTLLIKASLQPRKHHGRLFVCKVLRQPLCL